MTSPTFAKTPTNLASRMTGCSKRPPQRHEAAVTLGFPGHSKCPRWPAAIAS